MLLKMLKVIPFIFPHQGLVESGREKDKMLKVLQVNLALFPLVHLQLFMSTTCVAKVW